MACLPIEHVEPVSNPPRIGAGRRKITSCAMWDLNPQPPDIVPAALAIRLRLPVFRFFKTCIMCNVAIRLSVHLHVQACRQSYHFCFLITQRYSRPIISSKHKTFVQHLYNFGPTSSILAQHFCTNVIKMFSVCWDGPIT